MHIVQLLRRMSDLMDMNTLAEGEECAICMEKMDVDKCYRSVTYLLHPYA
jgi:hypothetical protein